MIYILLFNFSFTYIINKCHSNFISNMDSISMCYPLVGNDYMAISAGSNSLLQILTKWCYNEGTCRWNPLCCYLGVSLHFHIHHTQWGQNTYKVLSILHSLLCRELDINCDVGHRGISSSQKYMVFSTTAHIFHCAFYNRNYVHDFILHVLSSKGNLSNKPHSVKF